MDPKDRELLERTVALSEENNRILRGLQRSQRFSAVWGFVKLTIFIVPLIAGYIFLQPYLNNVLKNYSQVQNLLKNSSF